MYIGNATEIEVMLWSRHVRFDTSGIANTSGASNLCNLHFV